MLYLVKNRFGCVESPMYYEDIRKSDTVIAEFQSDGFYTDEDNFERFANYVRNQEGKEWISYNADQLKELHKMWRETLQ